MSDEVRFSVSAQGVHTISRRIVVRLIRDGIGEVARPPAWRVTREWLLYRISGEARRCQEIRLQTARRCARPSGRDEVRTLWHRQPALKQWCQDYRALQGRPNSNRNRRTAPRGGERVSQGEGRVSGKSPRPAGVEADNREKSVIVSKCLLKSLGLARSTYSISFRMGRCQSSSIDTTGR